ncbi:phosphate signaling complex protein PhoU [Vibrio breoganii]|uniref:Phosphate-specific transport system accessory protein PhoU n=1 Tax=Vibrio breoganii TaxID=553239 RepID=A0AAJ5EMA8_9VIBR|nr:phosphate signaling complex protein PhoU [Vibrio breoganii]ANO32162.1 phosphate transport system regulatory protein PhoU [Vibrio breoganii]MDN3717540.1 phosphate signaling complex protein PhoU [Vibrio breoganii]NMO73239.1 phosphate signaling complex protein PhoU [Vibrio breoganii]NMR69628.1 phosphate signaling complex protein PhoU [Vibrio breoganii]OCH75907.1 phosphate transport system regulatory protein PhoU [Vibrio breoganii]
MHTGRHISGQYNVELEAIRSHVLTMGGLVEQQLAYALRSLVKQDYELAKKVVAEDHNVNSMEVVIDEACTRIIARRQPTAGDLRLVMTIIKTITELERIGDVASRLARTSLENKSADPRYQNSLEPLCRLAIDMLHQVLDAFARLDIDAAANIYEIDDRVDEEYQNIIRQLTQNMMDETEMIPTILQVMWSARAIERVGDRCQNICEYIIYCVKGKDVRHSDDKEIYKYKDKE